MKGCVLDHLLFVLALILICLGTGAKGVVTKVRALHLFLDTRHWTLLKTVTAFTLSHSITLSLAALGYIHVPQPPVEAAIALSIVFVASEILRMRSAGFSPLQPENDGGVKEISDTSPMRTLKRTEVRAPSLTARAPWVVAFSFGLMHGLGFASGLSEAGLPAGHIPPALLFFSIGVEAGHFLFIGVFLSLITLAVRVKLPAPRWAQLVPPYAIGGVAMFWVIQRIAAF